MGFFRVFVPTLLVCAGVAASAAAQTTTGGEALEVARALVEAFNRHDPEAMAALASPDFELYYVGEDGAAEVATRGSIGLRDDMRAYFEARPSVRSRITGTIGGARFVAFREQIVGGDSSLAIYEIVDRRVRRAWYYPAEPGAVR